VLRVLRVTEALPAAHDALRLAIAAGSDSVIACKLPELCCEQRHAEEMKPARPGGVSFICQLLPIIRLCGSSNTCFFLVCLHIAAADRRYRTLISFGIL